MILGKDDDVYFDYLVWFYAHLVKIQAHVCTYNIYKLYLIL